MRRKMAASSDEPVSSLSREVWSVLAYISENVQTDYRVTHLLGKKPPVHLVLIVLAADGPLL